MDSSHSKNSENQQWQAQNEDRAKGFYETYAGYNVVLRAWFVALGIGAPTLLLLNADIAAKLRAADALPRVAWAFLVGVAAQVLVAWINKMVNWTIYYSYIDKPFHDTSRRSKIAHRISNQFWWDLVADVVSILAFGFAFLRLMSTFG